MPTRRPRTAAPAPEPQGPEDLLMAALQAMAAAQPQTNASRRTSATQREQLSQPLTARDRAALSRMGWVGRLSSGKPAAPRPHAGQKPGPVIRLATFRELSPERQRSAQFWAGLCSVISRSAGRVWIPEVAAVACQLEIPITGPSQLAARLAAITGTTVTRPTDQAGWLLCDIQGEMPGAQLWAQLWNSHAEQFGALVIAEGEGADTPELAAV